MKQLIYSIDKKLENLFIGNSRRDLTISGRIYKYDISFLWFKFKPIYRYTINVPFISNPFYDGEYSTNRTLRTYRKILKQELLDKIQEFKEDKTINTRNIKQYQYVREQNNYN